MRTTLLIPGSIIVAGAMISGAIVWSMHDFLGGVREAYQATGKPVLVMSYWNPIDRYGIERECEDIEAVRADLGGTVQRALEPEHLSVWMWEA